MNLFKKSFKPMLLKEIEKPFNNKNYIYEIKFDGIRSLIYVSKTSFKIKSRNELDITHLFPELNKIQEFVKEPTIFDGEIVIFKNGAPSFSKLQERLHLKGEEKILLKSKAEPVVFIVFDILYKKKNLINLPLMKRKKILNEFPDTEEFIKSIYLEEQGIKLFQKIKKLNLEGIVAKEKNSTYEPNKRVDKWLKIKNKKSEDFFIGGYIEKKSEYVFSVLLGEKKENKLLYVGKVSVSKQNDLYEKIKKLSKRKSSPFINETEKNVNYVNPKYICEVEFLEKGKEGKLRHPVFKKRK